MKSAVKLVFICVLSPFFAYAEEAIDVSPYIVGGSKANIAEYPFMASLIMESNVGSGFISPFCGASVLDERHVLTAAHCVYGTFPSQVADIKVAIEVNNLEGMLAAERIAVESIYYPDNYNHSTLLNDVAVLKLSESLPSYMLSHAVVLGDLNQQGYRRQGEEFTIIGYGRLSSAQENDDVEFMKANVEYVNPVDCNIWINFVTSTDQVCVAGYPTSNTNLVTATCQGDSGGPLVWTDPNGVATQIGIVSFGPTVCGNAGLVTQSVFTDVSRYKDWIIQAKNGDIPVTIASDPNFSGGGSSGGGTSWLFIALMTGLALYRKK